VQQRILVTVNPVSVMVKKQFGDCGLSVLISRGNFNSTIQLKRNQGMNNGSIGDSGW